MSVSYPLNSATLANPTTPFYGGGGPSPPPSSSTIYKASSVTFNTTVGISDVPFTFPAVTQAGTYLIQGAQPIINNTPGTASPVALAWRINGTSPPYFNCLTLPGPVSFSIVLTLAVGDVVSITLGQTGGASVYAVGGVASITKVTLKP